MLSPAHNFQPTLAQLNDDTFATKEEAELFSQYIAATDTCRETALIKVQSVAPAAAQVIREANMEGNKTTMELMKRKITWGEAKQRGQALNLQMQRALLAVSQQMEANLMTQHQGELAQRQAASNALMQMGQPSRLPYGAYQLPSNGIHCTSSQMGAFYNTNCY